MMMMMKTRMRMRTRNSQELEQLNHVAEPFVRIWQTNTYWEQQTNIKASDMIRQSTMLLNAKQPETKEPKQLLEQKMSEKARQSEVQRF